MTANANTDAFLATPAGRGAVATLIVDGPDAARIVGAGFAAASGRPLADAPQNAVVFGRWTRPPAAGEELVAVRRSDERLELHCHGGTAVSRAILRSLEESGCRVREWRQWSAESTPDLLAAEARAALAEATTGRAAAVLLDQLRGALRREADALAELLAAGDSSEANEPGKTSQPDSAAAAAARLAELLRRGSFGLRLVQPWRVVLAGRPNVGKSSLINALLGYTRAIVFDLPGTTRDVLTAATAIEGWPVELTDTAGLRRGDALPAPPGAAQAAGSPAPGPQASIEAQGMQRARARMAAADLVVFVAAIDEPWTDEDRAILASAGDALVVYNKRDLAAAIPADGRPRGLAVSAKTGGGVEHLVRLIALRLFTGAPRGGVAVPFTPRQMQLLKAARSALERKDASEALAQLAKL